MVLLGRIELPTSPLPRVRSTTELQQRAPAVRPDGQARAIVRKPALVKRGLEIWPDAKHGCDMADMRSDPARQERLAARLRENLRRRKAQARALDAAEEGARGAHPDDGPALSKSDPKIAPAFPPAPKPPAGMSNLPPPPTSLPPRPSVANLPPISSLPPPVSPAPPKMMPPSALPPLPKAPTPALPPLPSATKLVAPPPLPSAPRPVAPPLASPAAPVMPAQPAALPPLPRMPDARPAVKPVIDLEEKSVIGSSSPVLPTPAMPGAIPVSKGPMPQAVPPITSRQGASGQVPIQELRKVIQELRNIPLDVAPMPAPVVSKPVVAPPKAAPAVAPQVSKARHAFVPVQRFDEGILAIRGMHASLTAMQAGNEKVGSFEAQAKASSDALAAACDSIQTTLLAIDGKLFQVN